MDCEQAVSQAAARKRKTWPPWLYLLYLSLLSHTRTAQTQHYIDTLLQANVQLLFEWILMHTGTFAFLEFRLLQSLKPVLTSLL